MIAGFVSVNGNLICLIGTGIPFRDLTHLDAYIAMFKDIIPRTAGIRRPGSAALDLAYVANGRYDGFWKLAAHGIWPQVVC